MAGSSLRPSARVAFAVLLAATHFISVRVLAGDCPSHEPLSIGFTDPTAAHHLPEALRTLASHERIAQPQSAGPRVDATTSPVPPDQLWWNGFGLPVLNSVVHAAIVHEGALIVAGEFTLAAGQRVSHIARWDGSGWTPLGSGLDGTVFSLAVYEGRLIAGGDFVRSGTVPTGCIAQWDGSRWSELGEPAYGCVHAFASHNGSLIAGGCFSTSRGVHNVGAWDGRAWAQVGDDIGGVVLALASYQNQIVAGGSLYSTAGPSLISRFDGAAWLPLGDGVPVRDGFTVNALTVFQDELIAGGWFDEAGGMPVRSIARWNGARWDSLGGSPHGAYEAFLVDGDELLAAGSIHDEGNSVSLAQWNGASWSAPAEPLHGVRTLTKYQGSVIAGGYFQETWPSGEPYRPVPWLGRLEGSRWKTLESWSPNSHGVMVSGGAEKFLEFRGQLVVAGSFQYVGSDGGWLPMHGLAEWNGWSWSSIADLQGYVYALDTWQGDLIVGGNFYMPQAGASGAARWDGSHWSAMGSASPMRALAVYRGDLYAAGFFWSGSQGEEGVARWNGSQWQLVGGGFPFVPYGTWISALAVYDDRLIAAGRFDRAGVVDAKNIAAWDGNSWQPIGSGREFEVQSLAVFDGALHAGGAGSANGSPSALARWDGSAWQGIDIRGCSYVSALHATDRQLFVGGQFSQINGIPTRNVAVWNKRDWSTLGSGVDSRPNAFGEYAGSLYVGGWFTEAGNKPSFGIARWDGLEASPRTLAKPTLKASPNPFRTQTEIAYRLPAPGRVVIEVFDVRGRKVDTVLDRLEGGGLRTATWRPSPSTRVTPGLYFARISTNGMESVARIAYAP